MAKHARLSASGSKRYINCKGSIAFCDNLPDTMRSGTNPAAQTGTCAHAVGEQCLAEGKLTSEHLQGKLAWIDANEDAHICKLTAKQSQKFIKATNGALAAEIGEDVQFFCEIDSRMVEGVDVYLDTIWEDWTKLGRDVTEMSIERGFDLSWLRPEMFGTSDCTLYQFMGRLAVYDYKNGRVDVEVKGNTQGMYYALGMAHEVDWLFEDVEIVVVQPNSYHEDGKVRRWVVSKEELKAFEKMLGQAHDDVQQAITEMSWVDDDASYLEWCEKWLSVGDDGDHCTYCDGFTTCPVARQKAIDVAKTDFADCNEDPKEREVDLSDHTPEDLRRLEEVLNWTPFLDRLVKSAAALAEKRLSAGKPVPGHKIVSGRANRSMDLDADDLLKELRKRGVKVLKKDLYEPPKPKAIKSPAQLEKISKEVKTHIAGVWDEALECWAVAPLATKGYGKPTVVRESDPRKALELGAKNDFEEDVDFVKPV